MQLWMSVRMCKTFRGDAASLAGTVRTTLFSSQVGAQFYLVYCITEQGVFMKRYSTAQLML